MRDSQLVDNIATTIGGCIYTTTSALDVYNSTFHRNTASEAPAYISVAIQDFFASAGRRSTRRKSAACVYICHYTKYVLYSVLKCQPEDCGSCDCQQ